MDYSTMTLADLEARMVEIRTSLDQDGADIDALTAEVDAIEQRKKEIVEQEAKAEELRTKVAEGEIGTVIDNIIPQEERKMSNVEVRNTLEYGKAFVKAMLTGDDTEARALLTIGVSGGQIPVPETLEKNISNAWENCEIMTLVSKANMPGTFVTSFELSATGAVVHVEGNNAPSEEVVELGIVKIEPQSIKKWITVSDEAIDNTTIDTLGYIYSEIAQRIVEKAENIVITKIVSAPATSTATACGVPVYSVSALGVDTIVQAVALLCGKAKNLNVAMNRRTYAALVSLALNANYGIDVFDGLKDKVVFTDELEAAQDATTGDTIIVIGDFSAIVANFPNGNDMTIKTDDLSLAEKDLVKVVGRQYVGIGIVAEKRFVKVTLS